MKSDQSCGDDPGQNSTYVMTKGRNLHEKAAMLETATTSLKEPGCGSQPCSQEKQRRRFRNLPDRLLHFAEKGHRTGVVTVINCGVGRLDLRLGGAGRVRRLGRRRQDKCDLYDNPEN